MVEYELMSQFASKWYKPPKPSLIKRIVNKVRSEGPLKPRLEHAIRYIRMHIVKLDGLSKRLMERDRRLFRRVITAAGKGNSAQASVLANEVAEVRKVNKMVVQCKLALEQIELRLNTVKDLGDIAVTLAPAGAVVNNVKSALGTIIPTAESSLSEMNEVFNSILIEASQTGAPTLNIEAANEDAEKIIAEASAVAEQRMKEHLPELPTTLQQLGEGAQTVST